MRDKRFLLLFFFYILTLFILVISFTDFGLRHEFNAGAVAMSDFVIPYDMELELTADTKVPLLKDQILVRQGDIVSEQVQQITENLKIKGRNEIWIRLIGATLLTLYLLALFGIFAQHEPYNLWTDETMVYLISCCYGFGLLLFFVFQYIHVSNKLFFLLNPVPFLVIIYAVFFSNTLSFAMAILFSTIFSFAVPIAISSRIFTVSVLANILGVFSVSSRQSRRVDISRAGLLIGVASFLILLGLELIRIRDTSDINFATLYLQPICGFFNGIICGIIALGSIPVLEVFFRITTSTRLLELLQPNHPLMQRLLKEAPGTYHHSMLVADLAEKAAEAVQANSLLAKAAAFYHDVGKIKRPYFFVENQMGGVNYHDNLQPSLSTLIITSHTNDGVEIGKGYNLPKVILDVMVQHHGTDLVSFFHNKAKMNEKEDNLVQEETFRYDGVKPQTKEAGIIMICDAVEAASRTLLKPTPSSVELLVRRIVDNKDEDGQFDECNLTKRELETVVITIVKKLVSMFHNRVRYPDSFEQATVTTDTAVNKANTK